MSIIRTGLERIPIGSDGARLVYWFQRLLYVCKFYDLRFEISHGKISFSKADKTELEPINGGYEWEYNNITDLVYACNRITDNRANFDSRYFNPEGWQQDNGSFFNTGLL